MAAELASARAPDLSPSVNKAPERFDSSMCSPLGGRISMPCKQVIAFQLLGPLKSAIASAATNTFLLAVNCCLHDAHQAAFFHPFRQC